MATQEEEIVRLILIILVLLALAVTMINADKNR